MFRLSDATRRQAAMGLFLLLCVVPTAVMVAVGIWRCLPGRVDAEARRLTLLLGQPVHLESVRYLRPNTVLYEGIEIHDPETGAVLLLCDRLRAERDVAQPEEPGRPRSQLRLFAGEVTVAATSCQAFRPMVARLLQRRIGSTDAVVKWTAKQIRVDGEPDDFALRQICAEASLTDDSSKIEVNLRVKDHDTPEPIYLCLVRNRAFQPPVDGFDIYTGGGPLPCSLLAALLPQFGELGDDSRFQGRLVANHTKLGWEIDLAGNLASIDLRRLVGNRLPHEISGAGDLRLDRVLFQAGRIRDLRGTLRATDGAISRTLVASCQQGLGLSGNFPTAGGVMLLPFSQLAVRFHLDGSGLGLWGECAAEPKGAMLLGGYNQRLDAPDPGAGPIPVTRAVAALTATPENRLLTSRHAAELLERIPFVSPAPAATIATPPPVTPPGNWR